MWDGILLGRWVGVKRMDNFIIYTIGLVLLGYQGSMTCHVAQIEEEVYLKFCLGSLMERSH
jgi:hypothetical protein